MKLLYKAPKDNELVSVVWDGDKPNPRPGLVGRMIDLIFGVRVTPGPCEFVATHRDGTEVRSSDGCTWTPRSTPSESTLYDHGRRMTAEDER